MCDKVGYFIFYVQFDLTKWEKVFFSYVIGDKLLWWLCAVGIAIRMDFAVRCPASLSVLCRRNPNNET